MQIQEFKTAPMVLYSIWLAQFDSFHCLWEKNLQAFMLKSIAAVDATKHGTSSAPKFWLSVCCLQSCMILWIPYKKFAHKSNPYVELSTEPELDVELISKLLLGLVIECQACGHFYTEFASNGITFYVPWWVNCFNGH